MEILYLLILWLLVTYVGVISPKLKKEKTEKLEREEKSFCRCPLL